MFTSKPTHARINHPRNIILQVLTRRRACYLLLKSHLDVLIESCSDTTRSLTLVISQSSWGNLKTRANVCKAKLQ